MENEVKQTEEIVEVKRKPRKAKAPVETKEKAPVQEEAPTPVVKSLTEQLYDQIQEPEAAANLAVSAKNLAYRFNNNWFSVSQIVKKTNIKEPQVAAQLMMMLELAGHAQKRERETGGYLYKIQLSKELQLAELKKQADELLVQHKLILEAVDRIENPQAYEKAVEEIQEVESL